MAFCIKRTSEKVAVVGAGYIAVELAGVLQQLGSETHLFVRKHAPLRNFDPLLTDTLTEIIEQSDMTLHKHAIPQKVEKSRWQFDVELRGWPHRNRRYAYLGDWT